MELARGADLDRVGVDRLIAAQEPIELRLGCGAGPSRRELGTEDIGDLHRRRRVADRAHVTGGTPDVLCRTEEFRVSIADVIARDLSGADGLGHPVTEKSVLNRGLRDRRGGSGAHLRNPTGSGLRLLGVDLMLDRYIDAI